jgi:hypothetical protein
MQPGIELNEKIATLMGWSQHVASGHTHPAWYPPGTKQPSLNSFAQTPGPQPLPDFSGDIAAAITVAEKFGLLVAPYENGWVAGELKHLIGANGAISKWIELNPHLATADSAALAICLSVMKITGNHK